MSVEDLLEDIVNYFDEDDLEAIKIGLQDPNVDPSINFNYALQIAIDMGLLPVVELLVADPRVNPAKYDNFLIRRAAQMGERDIVKFLLKDKRIDPSSGNNFLLRWATAGNYLDIIETLKNDPRVVNHQAEPLLKISAEEWIKAKDYFNSHQEEIKFSKKRHGTDHSFIKVEGEIYALAVRSFLGEGNFGLVKVAQTEAGENFALKIEGLDLNAKNNAETEILKILGMIKAQATRAIPKKEFKERLVTEKLYTMLKLIKGEELFKSIYIGSNRTRRQFSEEQKLDIALKCCEAIQHLHNLGILHNDIKAANFMADIYDAYIVIQAIDFGFSLRLKPNQDSITKEGVTYSFGTDIYDLGMLLKADLQLDEKFYKNMLMPDITERITLPEQIIFLKSELVKIQKNKINEAPGLAPITPFNDSQKENIKNKALIDPVNHTNKSEKKQLK